MSNGKKIKIPSKPPQIRAENVLIAPSSEDLLADAMSVLANELARYRHKSNKGMSLDLKEARIMQGYIKCLVDINKEIREMERDDDYSNLSKEELQKLMKLAFKDDGTLEVGEDEDSDS